MSTPLIGAGSLLRLGGPLPEENLQKKHHLRQRRLRRSTAAHRASSSGEHSLTGVRVPGAVCPPMSTPLIGAGDFLRAAVLPPEESLPKDDHLRPQRLRRSTAPNTTSSGEHSLAGGKRPKRSLPRSLVMKSKHQHFINTQILVSDKFDLSILPRIQEPKFGQFSRQ